MGRNKREELNIDDPLLREMIKNLCENVKKQRMRLDITQAELAIRSSLAQNTVAEIEQARIENIRLSTVACIARGLKVKPLLLLAKMR
jgi:predicted transcriptional regulator